MGAAACANIQSSGKRTGLSGCGGATTTGAAGAAGTGAEAADVAEGVPLVGDGRVTYGSR